MDDVNNKNPQAVTVVPKLEANKKKEPGPLDDISFGNFDVSKLTESSEIIVVAEDSPPNRNILAHVLRKAGFIVAEAENGELAKKAIIKLTKHKIVGIFSDIMMPELDGISLLKWVRATEELNSIPFVLITAVTSKEQIMEAKELKVDGYMLKPVTTQKITERLKLMFPQKNFRMLAS